MGVMRRLGATELLLLLQWLLARSALLAAACGVEVEVHAERRGVIYSPSWPQNYPPGVNCSWSIQAGQGEVITISFRSLDLDDPGGCRGDWLLLSPAGRGESRVCGSSLPPPFISSRGRLGLYFHSQANGSGQAQGFRLSYTRGRPGQTRCQPDEFLCGNRKCLPRAWRCNAQDECGDGSDEVGCPTPAAAADPPGLCPRRTLPCVHGQSTRCLPGELRCDGARDCPDGSDERGCPDTACGRHLRNFYGSFASPDFFLRANRSPAAVAAAAAGAELRCAWFLDTQDPKPIVLQLELQLGPADSLSVYDGLLQQAEQLLQVLSHHNNRRTALLESSRGQMSLLYRAQAHSPGRGFNATYQVKGYCFPGERPCGGDQGCYAASRRCDGFWNCPSGRDEEGCPGCAEPGHYPCGPPPPPGHAPSVPCYPPHERCNNLKSCPGGDDESSCYECQPGNFHCQSNLCIPETWRCDGQQDCLDASDEAGCQAAVPRKVITAALIGSLVCSLLLVIALGCAFKLYSLRSSDSRAFETQMTRLEAEFVQREAPPSYGQLIAQGLIPPVEDFPLYNPTQTSVIQNLRSAMCRRIRRSSSRRRVARLWRRVSQRIRPRGHASLLTPPTGALALHCYRTVETRCHAPPSSGSSPLSPDRTSDRQEGAALSPGSAESWPAGGGGSRPSPDGSDSSDPEAPPPPPLPSCRVPRRASRRKMVLGLTVSLRGVALQRYSPLGHMSPSLPPASMRDPPLEEGFGRAPR
ncbi:low-density lipoprotein receptor-related protein 3 [Gadus chalcogrammus]|uniref:low-density lipoprotein receptor-related protein 3 n=1 Tax=Gadus chalcogrammus TaxID=1042646 RepID=UPI0024C4BE57|nr:low-density lipoprotein receptor-related protein 3 [Gadus chalcogrammus]